MKDANRWFPEEDSIDAALAFLGETSSDHGNGAVEAFHRSSSSTRLEWNPSSGEFRRRFGREEGGALRWIDPRDETIGFAAASGHPERSFRECRSIAAAIPGRPVEGCPWNTAAEPVEDIEAAVQLPGEKETLDWLRRNTPDSIDSAWVEIAVTAETWLSSHENVQKRVRSRAWAAWTPRSEDPRPLFLAARSWADLSRSDLLAAWHDRALEEHREYPWPEDARLVFSQETSAFLSQMLAATGHRPGLEPGTPVGPGWVLTADTGGDPPSLFGSCADDAGFPTETRVLADGRHAVGTWGGPGAFRRGSFRDPPESRPLNLRVEPPRIDPPRRAAWVTGIEIHPVSDRWAVRLLGRRYPDGAPFRPKWARFRPSRLIETCLGGIGPALSSHVGMTTPSLVFDELSVSAE